jgi:hypothetical protein
MIAHSIAVCTSLAFVKNLSFETGIMHTVLKPALPIAAAHRDALAFQFKTVWTLKKCAAAMIVSATTASLAVVGAAAIPVVGPYVAATAVVGMSVAAMVVATRKKIYSDMRIPGVVVSPKRDPVASYRINRSSNPPRTKVESIPSTPLPDTEPSVSQEAVLNAPLDVTADIIVKDITARRGCALYSGPQPVGIVSTMSIPVKPANSSHSSVAALVSRTLNPQPAHDASKFCPAYFKRFREYALKHVREILPGLVEDPEPPTPFNLWNERFPLAQQKSQEKALRDLGYGNLDELFVDCRGCFVKMENLSKSTVDGSTLSAPRAIQSASAAHNVTVAPTMHSFSKRLKDVWSVFKGLGPVYTSGANSADLGDCFEEALKACPEYAILEGDYERFDSTIHRLLLELEADIYKLCGCSERVFNAILNSIFTRGRDKWGNKYSVDGGRHSGDPNTSCGNTLIQGLVKLFCFADWDAQLRKSDVLLAPWDIIDRYRITMMLLGDDNLTIGHAVFLRSIPLAQMLLRLGLRLVPILREGPNARYHATFCSSRFYPVHDSDGRPVTILATCLGRALSKAGWYCDVPVNLDPLRLLRGDSIGRRMDCSGVPFLGPYWKRTQELSSHIRDDQLHFSAEMKRRAKYDNHADKHYVPCDATYAMVEAVYGLTRKHEQEYTTLLNQVTTLPFIVDYEPLAVAMKVDGVLDDVTNSITTPVDEQTPMSTFNYPHIVRKDERSLWPHHVCCNKCLCRIRKGSCKCPKKSLLDFFG